MSLFENISKKVTDTAKAAAKKSGELVEVTKLSMAINTEENKIEKAYNEIGKAVYEAFVKGEEYAAVYSEQCGKIKTYEENISQMKEKILELKNIKICSSCGNEMDTDVMFCSKCGAKFEVPEPVVQETEKKCPNCEAVNSIESVFCFKCGSKLE